MREILRRITPAFVVSLFYFSLLAYPLLRALWLAFPQWDPGSIELAFVLSGPFLLRLTWEFWPNTFTRMLSALALTWLGCCFILFPFVAVFEIFNAFVEIPGELAGAVILISAGLIAAFAFENAQKVSIVSHELACDHIEAPLRVVQISDVHLGSRFAGFLERVVNQVNDQSPTLVLITGDLIDFDGMEDVEIAALAEITAPVMFSIGNHERYVDLEAIVTRLQDMGIEVLRNRDTTWAELQIVGIDDAEDHDQVARELKGIEPIDGLFRILMYHRPDGAEAAADWGIDLMLTGHTHNGQIFPFNWLVRRIFPRICGRYDIENMHLFVSPGTGTWGPVLRLGSRNEITVFDLAPAASD